ncbi:hypothetical protein K2173_006543 [Erythroxylum novogranatense]|uniref:DUF7392 domain-containing protein n=1 Tax=Erythroxylum novogranatense TaxID=1862640 RepID=A0AAV8T6D5_9ROSI|nr:hypothetical protein K2173_006543 [Erythroxylum novogranatense]
MAFFVPFNNRNLDVSFLVFKPTVVVVDQLIEALRHLSSCTQSLGCVQSSILKSIHGNMILWCGAWMKRSSENKELLTTALLPMLANTTNMAVLHEYCFFDAYAGESRNGFSATKFSTGDAVSIISLLSQSGNNFNELSYANLAIFKSWFFKMDGATSGVCLKSQNTPRVVCLYAWKSLQHCYSWILNTDYRASMIPYLEPFSLDVKYDIFRVVYVSSENAVSYQQVPPNQMLENGEGGKAKDQALMQQ